MVRAALVLTALMCAVPALASAAQSLGVTSSDWVSRGRRSELHDEDQPRHLGGRARKGHDRARARSARERGGQSKLLKRRAAVHVGVSDRDGQRDGARAGPGVAQRVSGAAADRAADLVGIDLVPSPNLGLIPTTHIGGQLVQTSSGNVQVVLGPRSVKPRRDCEPPHEQMSLTINGTLGGKPFTRMPTNCSPGSSTITIAYANKTETSTASPDFKPTGCASLPFSPTVTGSAVEDLNDARASPSPRR